MAEQWAKVHLAEVGAAALSDREFRVYLVFKIHRNSKSNKAWPGRARVAELLNCTERSLERHISALIKKGWLTPANKPYKGQQAEYFVQDPAELQQIDVAHPERATTIQSESYNNSGAKATTKCSSQTDEEKKKKYQSTRARSLEDDLNHDFMAE